MEKFKRILKRTFIVIIVVGVAVFIFLNFANYSDGYRAGIPIKLSKKGVLIKTFEGQLNEGGMASGKDGIVPTVWEFTVPKSADSVAIKLDKAILEGRRVKLSYKERYVKFFWKGDTKYFVYDVELLDK